MNSTLERVMFFWEVEMDSLTIHFSGNKFCYLGGMIDKIDAGYRWSCTEPYILGLLFFGYQAEECCNLCASGMPTANGMRPSVDHRRVLFLSESFDVEGRHDAILNLRAQGADYIIGIYCVDQINEDHYKKEYLEHLGYDGEFILWMEQQWRKRERYLKCMKSLETSPPTAEEGFDILIEWKS